MKCLYTENYKILVKETEEDTHTQKEDTPFSWVGRTNIVKMSMLPKIIYRFNIILIKIPVAFLQRWKIIQKFVWNHKRSQIAKLILKKKNKAGGIILSDFKLYYKAIVSKKVSYKHKNSHKDQGNRVERPEVNLWLYNTLIYNRGAKNIQ